MYFSFSFFLSLSIYIYIYTYVFIDTNIHARGKNEPKHFAGLRTHEDANGELGLFWATKAPCLVVVLLCVCIYIYI